MRLVTVTLWVLAGAALTGAAYWSFLLTPESTVWTLAVSAVLLLTAAFLVGLTISGAILGWQRGISANLLRAAIAGVPALFPAALLAAVIWWVTGTATDRVAVYSGPINAWFIATFGWADMSWLFTGIAWLANWLKWVVAPMLAVSVMAGIILVGWRVSAGISSFKHALAPLNMAMATVVFAALVAAPWLYLAPWRPEGLPPTSMELAFIITKLSVTALLMATGVALIIRQATWTTSTPSSAS